MRNVTAHTGKLEVLRRLPSSRNGNPRYLLRIDGWTCRTKPDSKYGYSVPNLDGKTVKATIVTYHGFATVEDIWTSF